MSLLPISHSIWMDAILNARASYSGLCCFSLFFPFLFLFDFSLSFSSDLFPFHSLQFFSLFQTLRFFPHLWSGWRGLYYHRSLAMHVEYILPAVNAVGAHKNSRIFSIQRVVKLTKMRLFLWFYELLYEWIYFRSASGNRWRLSIYSMWYKMSLWQLGFW